MLFVYSHFKSLLTDCFIKNKNKEKKTKRKTKNLLKVSTEKQQKILRESFLLLFK